MRIRVLLAAVVLLVIGGFVLAGCGDKATERFRDAGRGETNDNPADIVTMPDGFSNLATKCDHGNRVYVAFKANDNRAAIAVVPNAKDCQ